MAKSFNVKDYFKLERALLEYGDSYPTKVEVEIAGDKDVKIEESSVHPNEPKVDNDPGDAEEDIEIIDVPGSPPIKAGKVPKGPDAKLLTFAKHGLRPVQPVEPPKVDVSNGRLITRAILRPDDWTTLGKGLAVYRFLAFTKENGKVVPQDKASLAISLMYSLTLTRTIELAPGDSEEIGPVGNRPKALAGVPAFSRGSATDQCAVGPVAANANVAFRSIRVQLKPRATAFDPFFFQTTSGKQPRLRVAVVNPKTGKRLICEVTDAERGNPPKTGSLAEVNPADLANLGLADGADAVVGFVPLVTPLQPNAATRLVPDSMPTRLLEKRSYEELFKMPPPVDPDAQAPIIVTFSATRKLLPADLKSTGGQAAAQLLLRVDGELAALDVFQMTRTAAGTFVPEAKPLDFQLAGGDLRTGALGDNPPPDPETGVPARRTGFRLSLPLDPIEPKLAFDEPAGAGGNFLQKAIALRVVAKAPGSAEVTADLKLVLQDAALKLEEVCVRLFDGYYKERGFGNDDTKKFGFLDANLDALAQACIDEDVKKFPPASLDPSVRPVVADLRAFDADPQLGSTSGDGATEGKMPGVPNFCIWWAFSCADSAVWPEPPRDVEDFTKSYCPVRGRIAQAFYVAFFRGKCEVAGVRYADSIDDFLAHLFRNPKNGHGSEVGAWDHSVFKAQKTFDAQMNVSSWWCASASNLAFVRSGHRGKYKVHNKDSKVYIKAKLLAIYVGPSWERNKKYAPAPGDIVSYLGTGPGSGHVVTVAAPEPGTSPATSWPEHGKFWYVSGNTGPSRPVPTKDIKPPPPGKKRERNFGNVNVGFSEFGKPAANYQPDVFNRPAIVIDANSTEEDKKRAADNAKALAAQKSLVASRPKGVTWLYTNIRASLLQPGYLDSLSADEKAKWVQGQLQLQPFTPLDDDFLKIEKTNRDAVDTMVKAFLAKK